jgi:hypothetical protein
VEDDKIVSEDPEEDEKIIEVSRRENLYELLARSIGIACFHVVFNDLLNIS